MMFKSQLQALVNLYQERPDFIFLLDNFLLENNMVFRHFKGEFYISEGLVLSSDGDYYVLYFSS